MTHPTPFDPARDSWLRAHHQAVLITLRRDGSPQSSNVSYFYDGEYLRVSVTAGRAKTRNAQRDPRVMLHVLGDNFWQYVAIQGEASLSAMTATAGDAAGQELLEVYQGIAGPHPDPADYYRAMVDDQRLVLRVRPLKATGYSPV